jgi:CO/xanthine dehydrogenase Mo-binding subunit
MGMPAGKVRVIWVEAAGSYGRLGVDDAAADAALLSREVGRPVRVQWQRADEQTWSLLNPGAVITVKAGLDKSGMISAWQFDDWCASHSTGERGNTLAWRALGSNPNHPRLSGAADKPIYDLINHRVVSHYTEEIVRAVYMRSVGGIQNVFAIEPMMDMLAEKAGVDPIEFRLRHLKDERMKTVLRATADIANWRPGSQAGRIGESGDRPRRRAGWPRSVGSAWLWTGLYDDHRRCRGQQANRRHSRPTGLCRLRRRHDRQSRRSEKPDPGRDHHGHQSCAEGGGNLQRPIHHVKRLARLSRTALH